jgi:hypothetical protein
MISCPDCGSSQYPGALFCSECGKKLLGSVFKAPTDVVPFTEFEKLPPAITVDIETLVPASGSKQILFVIPSSRRRLELELQNKIRIGRDDPEANVTPELDLTDDEGIENGISRLHAAIQLVEQGVILVDLGSTNGTSLNKIRLPAQKAFLLTSGDEIRFGDLLVHVFF